jgi:hypothetical protein
MVRPAGSGPPIEETEKKKVPLSREFSSCHQK